MGGIVLDDVMLRIGHVARTTGVSRRMLRHWEDVGLLAPAAVDPVSGYRRYAPSQVGRVRAIASLRAAGFGLEAIADLLGEALSEQQLVELLEGRENELVAEIDQASTRLGDVRRRLDSLRRGHRTMGSLHIASLPGLRLAAVQTAVGDESEISEAVTDLLARLREKIVAAEHPDAEIVLTYDGTSEDVIVVTAGVEDADLPGLTDVEVAAADTGVTVRLEPPPLAVGDAWIALDARVERAGLATCGVYRQTVTGGAVILQAPVRPL
ncbi:MAG: MerR family transcriptional regulator [Dermatophilaceae bacterium]